MTVRARLLGRPRVDGAGGQLRPHPRGQKSWSVLARIALSERPLRRAEVAEELFCEADDPLAALRWVLADLRRALGLRDVLRGDPLRITDTDLWLDVWALEDGSLPDGDLGGVLLEGVEVRGAPGFDLWLLTARAGCLVRTLEQLRVRVLRLLAVDDTSAAVRLAQVAVSLAPLDEGAQELLLRALVAAGRNGLAEAHLVACEGTFAREGLAVSPALRAAADDRRARPAIGVRASVVARSLLQAGTAALDAGAADGGIETLRRAAEDAARAADPALQADVLRALGGALVHAVRGFDGEGAVVLHRALLAARTAGRAEVAADVLRELAFIDVQAGRHSSAASSLRDARREAAGLDDAGLDAGILAIEGMNEADCGRHQTATRLLQRSADIAHAAGQARQHAWSLGVLARSLMLSGHTTEALLTAQASIDAGRAQRWNAFLPWSQAIHAECLTQQDRWDEAHDEAERAFALSCELADPCWEAMSARVIALIANHQGDYPTARRWIRDARHRSDRFSDHYVWVSCYVGLTQLELAAHHEPALAASLAQRLHVDATRYDLPEFATWALLHRADGAAGGAVRCFCDLDTAASS